MNICLPRMNVNVRGKVIIIREHMTGWEESFGVKEVFVLSGPDSRKLQRRKMIVQQIKYISTSKPDGSDGICDELGWKRLEGGQLLQHQAALSEDSSFSEVVLTDENHSTRLPRLCTLPAM